MATLIGDVTYRSGGQTTQEYTQDRGKIEDTLVYRVLKSSATETKASIVAAVGVTPYSSHPELPFLLARRFSIRPVDGTRDQADVEIFYTSDNDASEEEEENPLDRSTKIRVESAQFQRPAVKDRDGNTLKTAAGEIIDGLTMDDSRWVIQIEKNVAFIPAWVADYQDKVNDSPITVGGISGAEETFKVQAVRATEFLYDNGVEYQKLTLELQYRRDGWKLKTPHVGFWEVADNGGIIVPIKIPFEDSALSLLSDENPIRKAPPNPWPLDADGAAIRNPSTTAPSLLEFDIYETADFSVLPGVG